MKFLEKFKFLIYHFLLTQIMYICKGFCPSYLRESFMDDRLSMSYKAMLNTSHMGECIQACSNDGVCTSFFYNHGTKQCALVQGNFANSTTTVDRKGWMYYQCYIPEYNISNLFVYVGVAATWGDAKLDCKLRKAFLAEPDNKALSDFLIRESHNMTPKIGGSYYWVGGYYNKDDDVWKWDRFNNTFSYTDWTPSEGPKRNLKIILSERRSWRQFKQQSQQSIKQSIDEFLQIRGGTMRPSLTVNFRRVKLI